MRVKFTWFGYNSRAASIKARLLFEILRYIYLIKIYAIQQNFYFSIFRDYIGIACIHACMHTANSNSMLSEIPALFRSPDVRNGSYGNFAGSE